MSIYSNIQVNNIKIT